MDAGTSLGVGVLATLLAELLILAGLRLRAGWTVQWGAFATYWRLAGRLRRTGVYNMFLRRAEYVECRKEKDVTDYVLTAQRSLLYVGFWLAHGNGVARIEQAFQTLLTRGCTVELVLLDPTIHGESLAQVARYHELGAEALRNRLEGAWHDFRAFAADLDPAFANRFTLRSHREVLSASCFLFDWAPEGDTSKILVDFKIHGCSRDESFGMELRPADRAGSLYKRLADSFIQVKNGAPLPL